MLRHLPFGAYFVALLLAAVTPLGAQVRWDDAAQAYWITVRNEAGVPTEMKVEPTNRVVPDIKSLTHRDTATGLVTYVLRVGAHPTSPQSLALIEIPCPVALGIGDLEGGEWRTRRQWGGEEYCVFSIQRVAGDALRRISFTSFFLPGVEREAVVVGGARAPQWPTRDPNFETASVSPIVDSLRGASANGLVKRVKIMLPKYEFFAINSTHTGLPILAHELSAICTSTDWISPGPTCGELSGLLPSLPVSLRSVDPVGVEAAVLTPAERSAIRQALTAFIQALAAGRDTTIHQNAFAVLNLLARTVRAGLAGS
jgi:hypothetical protein